jgi:hypothetical protein
MQKVKEQVSKITANPIGALAGGVAVFFLSKKYTDNKMVIGLATVAGLWVGATAQAKFFAKKPTASDATPKK